MANDAIRLISRILGAACLLAASIASAQPLTARAVSGCYELAFDSWSDLEAWHGVPDGYLPPHRVVLDTVLMAQYFKADGRAMYAVRGAYGVPGPETRRMSSWSFISRDSIDVAWSDKFTGTNMTFRIAGDTLVGRIGAFTDAIMVDVHDGPKPFPRANAAGIRVPCDASADSSDPRQMARIALLRKLVAPKPGDIELANRENKAWFANIDEPERDMYFGEYHQRLFRQLHHMIARFRQATGHLPARLDDLAPYAPVPPPDERWMRDAWGKRLTYVVKGSTYELRIEGEPRPPNGDTGTVVSSFSQHD